MLNDKEIKVLDSISKNISLENYFFRTKKDLKWFYPLKACGYFTPEKAPWPQPTDQKGFIIPEWNVLPYLERVSQQVNIENNGIYIDELLEIIKNVSNYTDANHQHIDNDRTWWYFVKILLNIPNNKIPLEILDLVPIWLDSKFDTILQGSEIAIKLLNKFLRNESTPDDTLKAEKIVDHITAIKWVNFPKELRSSIFSKEEEPKTIVDTYWLIESFIHQRNALKVGEKCSEKPIYQIADRLKGIFKRLYPNHLIDIKIEDKTYYIFVTQTEDFEFDCSVRILKKNQAVTDTIENKSHKNLSAESEELFSFKIGECKNVESFIEKITSEISGRDIATEIEKELNEKLKILYENIFADISYIWLESLSAGPEIGVSEAEETLLFILRDIFLAKAQKDVSTGKKIIKDFLGEKYQYPLFKRLVLYVIAKCWNTYKEEFWEIIHENDGEQLFDDANYTNEIYTLLEKNITNFILAEREELKVIIEKGPQRYLPKDNQERYRSYWKQKWYSAVKADPFFLPLYNEQKKITHIEKEEIRPISGGTRFGPGPSPLTKEDLMRMSNDKVAEFLSIFQTKDPWNGPTVGGLSDTLQKIVQEQPEKFIKDLSPFINSGYLYIYDILWGITKAWKEKKPIDWGKLLVFVMQYIKRSEFWQNKFKIEDDRWNASYKCVVGVIGDLIQEGTKDDTWAFAEEYLPSAQEIIIFIIDNLEKEDEAEVSDSVMHALNSAFGETITALIYIALRIARLEDKKGTKKEVKWSDILRSKYEKVLNEEVIEAHTLLGEYIPNLHYLDKMWAEQKILDIVHIDKELLWSAFMNGYLYRSGVYDQIYVLMKEHYVKAMTYSFKERYAEERLVQHIAIGYLRGIESLSGGDLFGLLLKRWNYTQIEELIGFFWMQRKEYKRVPPKAVVMVAKEGELKPKIVKSKKELEQPLEDDERAKIENRIIDFWKLVFKRYKDKTGKSEEDKKVLSIISKLTVFLPKIDDENFKWLMLSAPYVHLDFSSPFFIEYLDKLKGEGDKTESAKYVAKIFLKMLDSFTPDFDQKHIKSIIEYLYQIKDKESTGYANQICNIYGNRGYDFLREIWENNNR